MLKKLVYRVPQAQTSVSCAVFVCAAVARAFSLASFETSRRGARNFHWGRAVAQTVWKSPISIQSRSSGRGLRPQKVKQFADIVYLQILTAETTKFSKRLHISPPDS